MTAKRKPAVASARAPASVPITETAVTPPPAPPRYTAAQLRTAIEGALAAVPFTVVGDVKYTEHVYKALRTAMPDCAADVMFRLSVLPNGTRELVAGLAHGTTVERVVLVFPAPPVSL